MSQQMPSQVIKVTISEAVTVILGPEETAEEAAGQLVRFKSDKWDRYIRFYRDKFQAVKVIYIRFFRDNFQAVKVIYIRFENNSC